MASRSAPPIRRKRLARSRKGALKRPPAAQLDPRPASQEDRERVLEQVFRVALEFGIDFGVKAAGRRRAFQKAERTVSRSPYRMSEAVRYQSLHQIAEILSAWYLEPAYLDEQGLPRALPLSGTKSFGTLCRRFLPRSDPREIADMLIAERLLLHRSDGCVIPLQRAARFASDSALMLDRIPMLFHALSSTLRHNARARSVSTGTRCEQGTVIARLPVEAIPAFNEHVKKLGHTLLNQTDAWASQRQEAPESEGRKVARVGVEVFAYVETEPPSRRGKRR